MKKIVAFILLTALFLNIIGYHFIFQIQQHKIKEDMDAYLNSSAGIQDAIQLKFSLADQSALSQLKWEDEKEFTLNEEMYDVIEKKNEGGDLVILCVKDKKESHLVDNYSKVSKEAQGDPSKNKSSILLKLIAGVFEKNDLPVLSVPDLANERYPTALNGAISSGTKEILIPPPQSC